MSACRSIPEFHDLLVKYDAFEVYESNSRFADLIIPYARTNMDSSEIEIFRWIGRELFPTFGELSLSDKITQCSRRWGFLNAEIVELTLLYDGVKHQIRQSLSYEDRETLLHALAFWTGKRCWAPELSAAGIKAWNRLLEETVDSLDPIDLHSEKDVHKLQIDTRLPRSVRHMTPLFVFLMGSSFFTWAWGYGPPVQIISNNDGSVSKSIKERMTDDLRMWVTILDSSGVSLEHYGARETVLFQRNQALRSLRWAGLDTWETAGPRLITINYGRRPEDWSLVWSVEGHED